MIWRIFMSATTKAAVHLGPDYEENLCTTKNTQTSSGLKHCSISRRVWSWITEVKFMGSQRSDGILLHGWDRWCFMTKQSSCQEQRYTSTQIPRFVLEICTTIQLRNRSGKNTLGGSSVPWAIKNYMESTESRSSSSGRFSQDALHWNWSERSTEKWQHAESNQKIS